MVNIKNVIIEKEQDLTNEEYVKKAFNLFLGRNPEEKALIEYVEQLNHCLLTRQQLLILLVESEEYNAKARNIQCLK
jgi:hypothetical protein